MKEQKKVLAKIKKKQRQDIQALIKSQIDREMNEKIHEEKERKFKEKEELNEKEMLKKKNIREKKLKEKEQKRIEELNRQQEEREMGYKKKEEKEQQRLLEIAEAEKQKQKEQVKKANDKSDYDDDRIISIANGGYEEKSEIIIDTSSIINSGEDPAHLSTEKGENGPGKAKNKAENRRFSALFGKYEE